MLADDEEIIRDVAGRMLKQLGLEPVTVESGERALELVQADPARFDCIILDLSMPGIDGHETLQRLRRIRRDLCVVLSSGYNEQPRFAESGANGFIQKPYKLDVLRNVLIAALT